MADKSPKTIATINFKGGVGKTTVTWCLGDVLSSMSNQNVLMFDRHKEKENNLRRSGRIHTAGQTL